VDAVDRAAVRAVQGLLGHRPGQAGGAQRLVERARGVVEHDAEAVPCRMSHDHEEVARGDAVSHEAHLLDG
jgi:hypothetical protein